MNKIVPTKLKQGDEVRVIAPSRSFAILGEDCIEIATKVLEDMGLKVTFGKNVKNYENEISMSASIKDRIEDLHEAFRDKNVKAILTAIGGFNSNQLLDYIDYDLIKNNPKILCGYSDVTALFDAITAKTGLVTYYGPHFSSFGMKYEREYIDTYFKKMFFESEKISVISSERWSNDAWYIDQENREFIDNKGMVCLNPGSAKGNILGGNLCTLNLLQGTEYMPLNKDYILFIEDDGMVEKSFTITFDRDLISLIHCIGKENVKGIVVGRAEKNCDMTIEKWKYIFDKEIFKDIPIVINCDFGHTTPMITIPLNGYASIDCDKNNINIEISD